MERRRAEPVVVERPEVPCVGIAARVTAATLPSLADRFDDLFAWAEAHSLTPTGPPFYRYRVVDMERELLVEVGLPLDDVVAEADGDVTPDVLPAGRYVVTTHVGHPEELVQVTADLLAADRVELPEGARPAVLGQQREVVQRQPLDVASHGPIVGRRGARLSVARWSGSRRSVRWPR